MEKTKKGSGLIFAVVLLFVILGMVVTLASVTVLETKMNQKTKSSVGAFYNADSGVEWALNKIATTAAGPDLSSTFTLNSDGSVFNLPSGAGYKIYLLDETGKVINSSTNPKVLVSDIKAVRSVGTQGGETQRAIEAAVADTEPNLYQTSCTAATGSSVGGGVSVQACCRMRTDDATTECKWNNGGVSLTDTGLGFKELVRDKVGSYNISCASVCGDSLCRITCCKIKTVDGSAQCKSIENSGSGYGSWNTPFNYSW